VTVSGVVHRDGKVTASVVGERRDSPDPLARATLENVSSWLVEAAPRQDAVSITFSYEIVPALPAGLMDLRVDLPRTVTIRANPGT
jgi:hypothetical protein